MIEETEVPIAPRGTRRMIYCSDPSSIVVNLLPNPVEPDHLRRWVDMLADSGVDTLLQDVYQLNQLLGTQSAKGADHLAGDAVPLPVPQPDQLQHGFRLLRFARRRQPRPQSRPHLSQHKFPDKDLLLFSRFGSNNEVQPRRNVKTFFIRKQCALEKAKIKV